MGQTCIWEHYLVFTSSLFNWTQKQSCYICFDIISMGVLVHLHMALKQIVSSTHFAIAFIIVYIFAGYLELYLFATINFGCYHGFRIKM